MQQNKLPKNVIVINIQKVFFINFRQFAMKIKGEHTFWIRRQQYTEQLHFQLNIYRLAIAFLLKQACNKIGFTIPSFLCLLKQQSRVLCHLVKFRMR